MMNVHQKLVWNYNLPRSPLEDLVSLYNKLLAKQRALNTSRSDQAKVVERSLSYAHLFKDFEWIIHPVLYICSLCPASK